MVHLVAPNEFLKQSRKTPFVICAIHYGLWPLGRTQPHPLGVPLRQRRHCPGDRWAAGNESLSGKTITFLLARAIPHLHGSPEDCERKLRAVACHFSPVFSPRILLLCTQSGRTQGCIKKARPTNSKPVYYGLILTVEFLLSEGKK